MNYFKYFYMSGVTVALTACGGGGGGNAEAPVIQKTFVS
jgi:hypothetical protein